MEKYISWRRVSIKRQAQYLKIQKNLINDFIKQNGGELVADYYDIHTGKDLQGCTELRKAINKCKEVGATLIIARMNRLYSSKEAFPIFEELDDNILFCDFPELHKLALRNYYDIKTINFRNLLRV